MTTTLDNSRKLDICESYFFIADQDRFQRWIKPSHTLSAIDPMFTPTLQGLGRLDARLVEIDNLINSQCNFTHYFGEHLNQSYLWVLSAYECIRTLNDRSRPSYNTFQRFQAEINTLKNEFGRLRVPLAKFEAQRGREETDFPFAYPALNPNQNGGIAWQVSQNVYITRRELSDKMLELFEKISEPTPA